MTSTNVFNGILHVLRTNVKFYYLGVTYTCVCSPADNLDNIVSNNFNRCDSSAMPISISTNESGDEIEISFRVSECGIDAGITSILLKKKLPKHTKKSSQCYAPNIPTMGANQSITISGREEITSIQNQRLYLVKELEHYKKVNNLQTTMIHTLMRENSQLKDTIQTVTYSQPREIFLGYSPDPDASYLDN